MRCLSLSEIIEIHRRVVEQSGGSGGILNLAALESAAAQPRVSFGGADLYPTLAEKAAALGYSLIRNHPFIDGNKRAGHAAMEVFLLMNGFELRSEDRGSSWIDEQEQTILKVAAGEMSRAEFAQWLKSRVRAL